MTIGELIRLTRKEKGMTQKQVAELCGMADSAIRKYESGSQTPKLKTIQRIATALGVEWMELVPEEQQGPTVIEHIKSSLRALQSPTDRINAAVQQMNEDGKNKVADYAEDILPRYRAQETATAPLEGTPPNAPETPPEGE